ncbi:leucine-rich_repeat domain-containing protein [Hexamita inflata]|uniref:Leucine-rich_repeat domain-containing protein n=1 Tax=Hexamita inflata TaxID=28002 RepID=A0ABP1GI79_9EUKA
MQNADQKQKCCLVTEETRFTDDDVRNSALFDGENIALEVDKQRYLIKMIQKYENQIRLKTWITVFSVSEKNEQSQIREIKYQTLNRELDEFGQNMRIECEQKDSETVLNQLKIINATLKVQVEDQFRLLKIEKNDELENLSFVNKLNIHKLVVKSCFNVKFHESANVKVLQVNNCGLQSIEGIQNWNQLLELDLYGNKLENAPQLENLTQLKVLCLGSGPFSSNPSLNLDSLRKLVNLTSLQLYTNKIENLEPLKDLVNLTDLSLKLDQIRLQQIIFCYINLEKVNKNQQYRNIMNPLIYLFQLKVRVKYEAYSFLSHKIINSQQVRQLFKQLGIYYLLNCILSVQLFEIIFVPEQVKMSAICNTIYCLRQPSFLIKSIVVIGLDITSVLTRCKLQNFNNCNIIRKLKTFMLIIYVFIQKCKQYLLLLFFINSCQTDQTRHRIYVTNICQLTTFNINIVKNLKMLTVQLQTNKYFLHNNPITCLFMRTLPNNQTYSCKCNKLVNLQCLDSIRLSKIQLNLIYLQPQTIQYYLVH